MDYAYAPPEPDDAVIQTYLRYYYGRANTTVLTDFFVIGQLSMEGLVNYLNDFPAEQKPIGDLFICSHGNETGWLAIRMTSILPVQQIDYDVLAQYGGRLALEPATITPPSETNPGTTVRFRACRIGQSEPFMQLMKQSFGGQARICAAKHFFSYGSGTLNEQDVVFEYLNYGFLVSVPEAERPKDRDAVIRKFRDFRYPATGQPFKYYDSKEIPEAMWASWIPAKAPTHKTTKSISYSLAAGEPLFRTHSEFRAERNVAPDPVPYTGAAADQAAYRQRALAHLQTLPKYQDPPTDPYPVWMRNGFQSLQAFVDGYTWTRSGSSLVGARMEYTLLVPIFNPADNTLLHNLTPTNVTGPPAPRSGLDETNPNLFWNQ